ncbi:hypothetical protein AX774_g6618 [Zancudomyces culisetae]|uniref:Uncharacterized protein n=1 Tax=Zancudomyces culisetae TaxID=1213189 RepID=A0A1R1PG41_ZANCU|nr:hypothetical protein AX774_g6618 [Zancudomyces culisetae]|eukprot:OMH79955.1 hypothetical protein AX774_g6618 [Zancudomyces culisetae]
MTEKNPSEPKKDFLGNIGSGIMRAIEHGTSTRNYRIKNKSADSLEKKFTQMHIEKQTMKAIEARKLGYPATITCELNDCMWCTTHLPGLISGKSSQN